MITNYMVSLAAGSTDLCLLTVLTDALALPLANNKAEALTIKKLTAHNPPMAAQFAELKKGENE